MINLVCIEGRLTKDPETFKKTKEYIKFRIAYKGKYKVEYFNCLCFHDSQIGYIQRYFEKNCFVLIKGKLSSFDEQDSSGNWITHTTIHVDKKDGALLLKPPKELSGKKEIEHEFGLSNSPACEKKL